MKLNILAAAVAAALSMVAASAHATNGYFSHGYGMKSKGMGGAAAARTDDAYGGANNPASMVWVGNRLDLGADIFSPDQGMSRSAATAVPGAVKSEDDYFLIPEFGYNRMIKPNMSVGVTVYGNGGMNTDYPVGGFDCTAIGGGPGSNALCGISDLGVDLMQLMIAPTLAYKINDQHSVGISPLLAFQRFRADGLHSFTTLAADGTGDNTTNRGADDSNGIGVRIGWLGKISDTVSVGASYSPKLDMSRFDKYSDLFAQRGDFDIPENFNIGVSVRATPKLVVALDYQRINYGGVQSISNSSLIPGPGTPGLGANTNGTGFGWEDVNVWKLGFEYSYSKELTLRAGWNHGDNPVQSRDVTFNILAPGVVQDHLTLGFTYVMPSGNELTMSYMHAFENDVTGQPNTSYFPVGGPGTENIYMKQNAIGIAYSWKM